MRYANRRPTTPILPRPAHPQRASEPRNVPKLQGYKEPLRKAVFSLSSVSKSPRATYTSPYYKLPFFDPIEFPPIPNGFDPAVDKKWVSITRVFGFDFGDDLFFDLIAPRLLALSSSNGVFEVV